MQGSVLYHLQVAVLLVSREYIQIVVIKYLKFSRLTPDKRIFSSLAILNFIRTFLLFFLSETSPPLNFSQHSIIQRY